MKTTKKTDSPWQQCKELVAYYRKTFSKLPAFRVFNAKVRRLLADQAAANHYAEMQLDLIEPFPDFPVGGFNFTAQPTTLKSCKWLRQPWNKEED